MSDLLIFALLFAAAGSQAPNQCPAICPGRQRCEPMDGVMKCVCPTGMMGKWCNRPCRDIYKSCERWKSEDKCDTFRMKTTFFDENCAVSCNQCQFEEATVIADVPLAPALEPLEFLIGRWESSFQFPIRYPIDFEEAFYHEILDIRPAEVPMFGTPSLNVTSIASNFNDGDDVRVITGFMTLSTRETPTKVALMCASNEGLNTVEIGSLLHNVLTLNTTYMQIHPLLKTDLIPAAGSRLFRRDGPNLEMSVVKLDHLHRLGQFTKFFRQIQHYNY